MSGRLHAGPMQKSETVQETGGAAGEAVAGCGRIREFRALLTAGCNYRCSFCHHEGACASRHATQSTVSWLDMIEAAVAAGCQDITLSGGEPTLVPGLLAGIVSGLPARCDRTRLPSVTVVSNGSHMNGPVIAALRDYPGKRKVNLSFHAANAGTYDRIVGRTRCQPRVRAGIRELVSAAVEVKLNVVVLRDTNDRPEDFDALMTVACELGASGVQFIPRVGVAGEEGFQREYVDAGSVASRLMSVRGIGVVRTAGRKTFFTSAMHPGLNISVTRCVCHLGCSACLSYRCLTLGPDLQYYPCMLLPGQAIPVRGPDTLLDAFRRGHEVIDAQAKAYGDGSPMTDIATARRCA